MVFLEEKEYVIITKHYIVILIGLIKLFFFILLVGFLYFISYKYKTVIGEDIIIFLILPVMLFILNYAFFKTLFGFIFYYNNFILFLKNRILIIKSSLFIRDDLETIDMEKVSKVDIRMRGIIKNIFGYGDIVIEQQREEVRTLRFVSDPYKVLKILRERTISISNEGKDLNFFELGKINQK